MTGGRPFAADDFAAIARRAAELRVGERADDAPDCGCPRASEDGTVKHAMNCPAGLYRPPPPPGPPALLLTAEWAP